MKKIIFAFVISIFLFGCSSNYSSHEYVIKEGHHYPRGIHFELRKSVVFDIKWMFDSTAVYNFNDVDQFDWNKLMGIKYNVSPHKNSARFVWRWNVNDSVVDIGAYCYIDGILSVKKIGHCGINDISSGTIVDTHDSFIFYFSKNRVLFKKDNFNVFRFVSYPYFGGNKKAPHDVNIKIWFKK